MPLPPEDLEPPDRFVSRHLGPGPDEIARMLTALGAGSLDELAAETVPASIRLGRPLDLPAPIGEHALLAELAALAGQNQVFRSYLGMGYSDCVTPPVILRNVLESPGWYTQYTPYQAEIAQGRLEALLVFQQMVMDLTAMEVANASLLDEATAAAEAMTMCFRIKGHDRARAFLVADSCHPQTLSVCRTRARPLGIEVLVADPATFDWKRKLFGALLQVPCSDGAVVDPRAFVARAHAEDAMVVMAADLLALTLLAPPGELGADVAVGSTQRFGVPMGYGGPHAAYFATSLHHVRRMPGRLIGVSKDAQGKLALRMALATREQHIRREKATSNICTAQVLLAIVAGMYAVYHGPDGLRRIARRVHGLAAVLARGLAKKGIKLRHAHVFDTLCVEAAPDRIDAWMAAARAARMNFRRVDAGALGIALDETTEPADVEAILAVLGAEGTVATLAGEADLGLPAWARRASAFLTHPVFATHHSETEMLRYLERLRRRDLSLTQSMTALGSCTMKLNATAEMIPVTWPQLGRMHPFAPPEQARGYHELFRQLEAWLAEITGFAAISLQPNAGSQGEYAGLLVIRRHHEQRGQGHRDVCLIPSSAHGTNPASAALAGLKVVVVACDDHGNVDVADLEAKAREHRDRLAALMVTYPSTHGVFEEEIRRLCAIVHEYGGQVYLDGANMNAQVGLCRPGDYGADVCHLNLHKTFAIPHGGGGPGVGPIGVAAHLARFLPRHPLAEVGGAEGIGPVAAAPWGSASVLVVSWAYIRMMGAEGLARASQVAILNANYVARRLGEHYPVYYVGKNGRVAHECILDMRHFKKSAGVEVEDIAKRLMDYGFHAPTISFPIPGTMMIEPTESEDLAELERFCAAMIAIREEIREIEAGQAPRAGNLLDQAPHTAETLLGEPWNRPYPRARAAYPLPWVRANKFWPAVGRVDGAYGDRHFVGGCPPLGSED